MTQAQSITPEAVEPKRIVRVPAWLPAALVTAGLLAVVLCLALCAFLPFQDVPNHAKVLALDEALRGGEVSKYLEPRPGLAFGYSLVVHLSRLASPIVGTAGVVRIVCILSAIGIPLATAALARASGGSPSWGAFLALPLALSWPLRVGLVPYVVALPFVVLGVAAALWAGEGGLRRRALALAGCSAAAYLAHPMAFGLLVVAASTSLLASRDRADLGRRVIRVVLGLGVVAPLLAWDLHDHRLSMLADADATLLRSPVLWRPVPLAMAHLVTRGLGVTGPDALVYHEPFLLLLAVATALVWLRPSDNRPAHARRALVAAALLGSLGTLVLPESRENVFLIASRVTMFGILFWGALAAPVVARSQRLQLFAVPSVALLLGFQVHQVTARATALESVLGASGPETVGGTFLPVQIPRCSEASSIAWGDYDPLRHAWAYALGPTGVAPYVFAGSRYQPVWFRSGVLGGDLRAPKEHLMTENESWRSSAACEADADERITAANAWAGTYDGILVTGRPPEVLEAIKRSGLAIDKALAPGMYWVRRGGARSGLHVQFGLLAGTVALRSGFYGEETIDGQNGQWSQGKESLLAFTLDRVDHDNELRLLAQSPSVSSMTLVVNDRYRTELAVGGSEPTVAYIPGDALASGANEIRFVYPSTFFPREGWSLSEPRELAVFFRELALSALPRSVALDVGTPHARKALATGFSIDEDMAGQTAAWSDGQESSVWLDVAGGAPEYLLTVRGKAVQAQTVKVTVNDRWSGAFQADTAWTEWTLAIPGDAISPGRNVVHFAYPSPSRPSDRGGSDDNRLLAVAFDTIALGPLPARLDVDFGAPETRRLLVSGFSGLESIDGKNAVWSDGKTSELTLTLNADPGAYQLTVDATARFPQHATVSWNGGWESSLQVPGAWSEVSVIVPEGVVRQGANTLRVTYDSPSHPDGDPRLLAIAFHALRLEPVRSDGRVAFGTHEGRPFLRTGWSVDEVIDGRPAVWSLGASSEIEVVRGAADDTGSTLDFTAMPLGALAPLSVQVRVNDQLVDKIIATAGWQSYRVQIPKGVVRSGINTVRWTFARTARPRDVAPDTDDARVMALALHEAVLR